MNNLKSISFIIAFTLLLTGCKKQVQGPAQLPDTETVNQFENQIGALMDDMEIDTYSWILFSNASLLKKVEQGITSGEKFNPGQVSELFLATMLLQCSEEELIDLRDYLGDYSVPDKYAKERVKNLLAHNIQNEPKPIHLSAEHYQVVVNILEEITGKPIAKLTKDRISKQLDMGATSISGNAPPYNAETSLNDLMSFLEAVNNQQLFEDEYTYNQMFRPIYLETGERTPAGLGCLIDITNDQKLIWSFSNQNDYSSLLIQSPTDSISFILLAKSPKLNKMFNLEQGDLYNSPVAFAFSELLENDSTTVPAADFYAGIDAFTKNLKLQIDSGFREMAYDKVVAYMQLFKNMGNLKALDQLEKLYAELFPMDIAPEKALSEPLASIDRAIDYMHYQRNFSLTQETPLEIMAAGEFVKELTMSPWEYDNIEIFFDLKHDRNPGFNSGDDDRQYRFNYDYPELTGNVPTLEGIVLKQTDPSDTKFNFEIAIPWQTLFNSDSIKPSVNQFLGFDIAVSDNDGDAREGSLAWYSKLDEQAWANTSGYGSMKLVKSPGALNDSICYAVSKGGNVILDGKNTGEWNGVPRYAIASEFMTGITGPKDQSAWFRAQWDDDNLYFFIEVEDDVKRKLSKTGDYGWITSAVGDTVWMMQEANTLFAGGTPSNRYLKDELVLEPGDYTLHYVTNQTNSMGRWINERPELSMYGILLYEE